MYDTHENNVYSRKEVPIWEKYALSVTEATQYFHIGRKKLREIINKDKYANYLVWNGGHVFIKRKLFEEYLDHEVQL
ncbi:MAG: excisionase [Aeriscardovia sp.]|nr:excisionase [Aeriscardovia sp.]